MTISLEHDGLGRETKRTFDLNGIEQQLTQVYNEVDLLVRRTLREGPTLLRDEAYEYDPRGRLILYQCEGNQPPVDPYGKAIISQLFRFDAMDNLTRVTTTYQGPGGTRSTNIAVYSYTGVDPTQLSRVTNSASGDGYPAVIDLEYDADGHLIRDEENRGLEYDALGRLISVSALPGETPSGYSYDPLDTLSAVDSGNGEQQRFYQGGELASLKQGSNSTSFMRGDGVVLAEHQAGADPKSLMLVGDQKNTLLSEVASGRANHVAFTPYGHPSAQQPVSAGLGYNGEFSEPQTGWQLLGNGYRAYNPRLMKFHSPDSLSPFGEGGVNAYAFCEGEPVLNVDLDGHSIWSWLKGYRSSTTQAYNKGAPKHFLQDSKGGAGVRTIRNKDVRRLGKVVKLRERELAETRNSAYEHSRDEIHVAEYELKHGKGRFLADAKKEMAEAGDILETASFLHGWAKSSVGELGFTKEGSMLLKIKALAYDKKAAAIRRQETQAYSQWQQDKMYRDNQERANAVGIPRANKRAHQAPNYRG